MDQNHAIMTQFLRTSLVGILTLFTTLSFAQPGTLDINFNGNGKLILDLGLDEFASAMAIQEDQKIVVAGFHGAGSVVDFAVTRLNPDGSLDNSFGSSGTAYTDFSASIDVPNDLIIQPDGKIVVSGFSNAGATITLAMARYLSDGTLDPDFGTGGKVATSGSYSNAISNGLHLLPDGKLLVCGYYNNGVNNDMIVARFNSDGSLDNTFSYDGFASYDVGGLNDLAYVVRPQSDGKILLAGFSQDPSTSDKLMTLVRFEHDGLIDLDFGTNGVVHTDFGTNSAEWKDLKVLADGKMILAGYANIWGTNNMAVARLNADGTPDTDFGTNGTTMYSFAPLEASAASSIIVVPDGRLIIAGSSDQLASTDFGVAMLGHDGTPDANFGTNGGVQTDFAGDYDVVHQVAMQDDGLLVAAGASNNAGFNIAVSRYISGINIGIGEVDSYLGSTLIYPNPILDRKAIFEYTLTEQADVRIDLFSMDGKFIGNVMPEQTRLAGDHIHQLQLPEISPGQYLLRLVSPKGQVSIQIIKK